MSQDLSTIAQLADEYYTQRELRLTIEKEAASAKAVEDELSAKIIAALQENEATGVAGKIVRVQLSKARVPTITDFDALWHFARAANDPSFFQRRVSDKAVKERWDAGETVPGVEAFETTKLHYSKVN